uniref:hypothetical protein n=1 Tax=Streptococcus pluranimalium TaxID=82348 RepID=UPI003F68E2F7
MTESCKITTTELYQAVKEGRINDFRDLKHFLGKSRGKSLYPISIDENGAIVLSIGYDRFKANYQKPKLGANGFISIPILNKYVLGFLHTILTILQ